MELFYLSVSILVGNANENRNFVISLLTNLTTQKFDVGQNFYFEIHVQIAISLSIVDGFQQKRAQNLS